MVRFGNFWEQLLKLYIFSSFYLRPFSSGIDGLTPPLRQKKTYYAVIIFPENTSFLPPFLSFPFQIIFLSIYFFNYSSNQLPFPCRIVFCVSTTNFSSLCALSMTFVYKVPSDKAVKSKKNSFANGSQILKQFHKDLMNFEGFIPGLHD